MPTIEIPAKIIKDLERYNINTIEVLKDAINMHLVINGPIRLADEKKSKKKPKQKIKNQRH